MSGKPARPDPEQDLIDANAEFSRDPYGWVLFAFPWGEPGPLVDKTGPDDWQRDILIAIGNGLSVDEAFRQAVASGHGIGKSALVSWLVLWAMATFEDTKGVVTANTEAQLRTKTWAELAKWYQLCICRHWFVFTATALYSANADHAKTWRIDQIAWSATNTEAFAGLHNEGKRIIVIFDEASAIDDKIWETTEGAMTDANTEIMWFAFGNPTRNTGRFRECFGALAHRWHHRQVDSRTVKISNKQQLQEWVDDYGEDSDFVRVRVRGVFPRAGSNQLIDGEAVDAAMKRPAVAHIHDPLVIGVDVARKGDDRTVIVIRKGRDARTHEAVVMRNADTMAVAAKVHEIATRLRADAVFIDETGGLGAGVLDRLVQLRLPGVIGINFASKSDNVSYTGSSIRMANKRAEMWWSMGQWMHGGAIEANNDLRADLVGVEYGYDAANRVLLEKKEDMKKRGLASPDWGDALVLTFAYPVSPSALAGRETGGRTAGVQSDYNPLDRA